MIDVDDYTQAVEAVAARERRNPRSRPLRARDMKELFDEWLELNPGAVREIELTAVAISERGMRVSTKYLVEKQRYEGRSKHAPVPWFDADGCAHEFGICNSITPLLARWLLNLHPDMDIQTAKSMFDDGEVTEDGGEGCEQV